MFRVERAAAERRLKNKIFQSRDLCLRALDTNSLCAKSVRRNEAKDVIKTIPPQAGFSPYNNCIFTNSANRGRAM